MDLILGIVIGSLIGYLIALIRYQSRIRTQRRHAIKSSKSVILWHIHEKIAPLLPHFPYQPKDMVFIGKGIDYLVFEGLSTGRCERVVLLEIKTGTSRLNANEQSIKSAIQNWRVSYQVRKPS